MLGIPLVTFHGFLKQHSYHRLRPREQELFDLLFPSFEGTDDAQEAYEEVKKDPLAGALSDLIHLTPGERRSRRFSGVNLGRDRYFTVCINDEGRDFQTLAHELRAYRNPIAHGLVEVIDLADGCTLRIGDRDTKLGPESSVAVLIHEPQTLPEWASELHFQITPGLKGDDLYIYRFPYRVLKQTIHNVVDLRHPVSRDWFFETFRELSDAWQGRQSPIIDEKNSPTIAYSRFHFENGQPRVPATFLDMLPTIMNPDLGGGSHSDTGSTLLWVANFLRNKNVAALIYPSARCDVGVAVKNGRIEGERGWILVDYRNSTMLGYEAESIDLVTFVQSPWAWAQFPSSVSVEAPSSESEFAGSFVVDGIVDYWAKDYLGQLRGLDIARRKHGREKDSSQSLGFRAFLIGSLIFRWLRMIIEKHSEEDIESVVYELQGLALPYGMYPLTGRVVEIWTELKQKGGAVGAALNEALGVVSRLKPMILDRYTDDDLAVFTIGADLEQALAMLVMHERSSGKDQERSGRDLLVSWFQATRDETPESRYLDRFNARVTEFYANSLRTLSSNEIDVRRNVQAGIDLGNDICIFMKSKKPGNHPKRG